MSGASIIAEILLLDAYFATVDAEHRLKEDRLPDRVGLPAYLIRTISGTDRNWLAPGPLVRSTERVSVTVRAGSVIERRAEIKRVRALCANRVGDFAGCLRVSVLTAGLSPSLIGPGDTFEQTQDFSVSFEAPL